MPFSCIFQLNNGAIKKSDEVILQEFINASIDAYHELPVKIARVTINGKNAFIYSNCPCYISSKGDLSGGDKITEETNIGYFHAEGESIPYNMPYAVIKFE
jgi:hypothetical protein